jgi:hypothetical protein
MISSELNQEDECCYHVQISLSMSQQTQSDIFHTKMLENALWCQITWSKCMLCNMCRIEKNPIMISPYPIFEVDKLPHDEFF